MARPRKPKPFWSDHFRALIDEREISVQMLAEAMNRTPGAVNHWLNGQRAILLDQFLGLCKAAGLDPVTVLYPGYIPSEFREKVKGLAIDVLNARPAESPNYRKAIAKLKRPIS